MLIAQSASMNKIQSSQVSHRFAGVYPPHHLLSLSCLGIGVVQVFPVLGLGIAPDFFTS